MLIMYDIGNAIPVEKAFDHGQFPDIVGIHEMNHSHELSSFR
jgi:hypothetical protein